MTAVLLHAAGAALAWLAAAFWYSRRSRSNLRDSLIVGLVVALGWPLTIPVLLIVIGLRARSREVRE